MKSSSELLHEALLREERLAKAAKALEPLNDYPPVGYEDELEELMAALAASAFKDG